MRKYFVPFMACALVFAGVGIAFASEGEGLPLGNFALRLLNILVVIGILWHFAGGPLKKYFAGRKQAIIQEMTDAARMKKEAEAHLADVGHRVANVEKECAALLEESRAQAESLKASILAEAEKQAAQIVEQAKRSAEQEGKAEFDAILARLADDVAAAVEKALAERLDAAAHQNLIDKSLTKVVFQ
jgi:F-type H+-transporting ATPase subunit b